MPAPPVGPATRLEDKVSLCTAWTLVKNLPDERHARPLYCRSWRCDICNPRRRSQLMAKAASGEPGRFVTLTVNPDSGGSPYDRLMALSGAWNVLVKRLRRMFPGKEVEYLAIVEETKAGEPHLHILLRSPFIPQKVLSEAMRELINAPIVDIRKIKNMREVIRYVAKYIAKAPAQFGSAKRYWCSKAWEVPTDSEEETDGPAQSHWNIVRESMGFVISLWMEEGWTARRDKGDSMVGFRITNFHL